MKKILSIVFVLALSVSLLALPVLANGAHQNTVPSSTMIFSGTLTDQGGGVYTGYIPMTAGVYYADGGFDVYAKQGGCAYCKNYYGTNSSYNCAGTDTYTVGHFTGTDHDAYPYPGGPWGSWYNPDCADWNMYALELTAEHWYLRYAATNESPMSGTMEWYGDGTGYAWETDKGTLDSNDDGVVDGVYDLGGPAMWDWNAGAQVERIPLQYPGFHVTVASGGSYVVTLKPAAATNTHTGTGAASFSTSAGVIEDLTNVATPAGAPATFPHGMFTFKITGLSNYEEVTLTIELPDPVPVGTKWWKYHNNTWSPMDIGDDDGDNVITVALKDDRTPDDEDDTLGQITDQGGPGIPTVGWESYPIDRVRVLAPWIALFAAIVAGVSLLVVRRRRAQS